MQYENKAKRVADRIADKIQSSESAHNFTGGWDDLQTRLDRMYQDISAGKPAPEMASQTANIFTPKSPAPAAHPFTESHPSQERFNINEAIVDELVEFFQNEKACSFEPNGKPCDHCAMCSSRGF